MGFGGIFFSIFTYFLGKNAFFYFWGCDIDFQKFDLTLSEDVLGAWKHYFTFRLMILCEKKSFFGQLQPIFPPETIKMVCIIFLIKMSH